MSCRSRQGNRIFACERLDKEVVVPSGDFVFTSDASFARFSGKKIQGDFPEEGEVFRSVIDADATRVLTEGDIQDPVQAVLNCPVLDDRTNGDAIDLSQLVMSRTLDARVGKILEILEQRGS
jgi:hypothetical protein